MSALGDRLTDLGYAAGWAVVRGLPEPVARTLFRTGADLAARRQGPDSQLRRNLARVLGVAPAEVPGEQVDPDRRVEQFPEDDGNPGASPHTVPGSAEPPD